MLVVVPELVVEEVEVDEGASLVVFLQESTKSKMLDNTNKIFFMNFNFLANIITFF